MECRFRDRRWASFRVVASLAHLARYAATRRIRPHLLGVRCPAHHLRHDSCRVPAGTPSALFLLGSDQAFHFLASLLANFTRLLLLLLGSERRVGADRFDLRTRIALRRPTLLHG